MKTAICLTLLCFVIGAYCAQKKASCNDPLSFYDNSCTGLLAADNLDEYCSKCCAGIAEFADVCVSEEAGDAVRQGCEVVDRKCGQKKASCDDPLSFYDNSCTGLTATADNLDEYCSKCCAGLAEFADECGGGEAAGDAVKQGCEALNRECEGETPTTGVLLRGRRPSTSLPPAQ